MLKAVAERLREAVRAGDIAARDGGDEFVAMLNDTDEAATAKLIAAKIAEALDQPAEGLKSIDGAAVHPSVSIRISIFPLDANTVDELMRLADKRMYIQKRLSAI